MNKKIKLDDPKNILQLETSNNNQINSNIIFNSQLNQTNTLNSGRHISVKSSYINNKNNINLLQSPKNIYKNNSFEEKKVMKKIQNGETNKKIVS